VTPRVTVRKTARVPADDFDPVEAFDVLVELADDIGRGSSPRQLLNRTLTIAQRFTGADAACYVAVEAGAARVVGTTPEVSWLDGRSFLFDGSALATLLASDDRSRMFAQADTAPNLQWDLTDHGVHRLAMARSAGAGAIAVFFTDPDATMSRAARAMLEYLAASMYPQADVVPEPEEDNRDLFLATTSHELRTPLTVVKGYADTLANRWSDLDEESRLTAVRAIRDRTGQLAGLVDRLLLASRSPSGTAELERVPFDLRSALAAAVTMAPEPRPILAIPDELPPALGDRDSIPTILGELLANAGKYSPVGSEIRITAGADASSVYFQVADRGIGVAPEHVDAVFDRFWQADRGDQRRYGGVGLGLYIIRRLLDRQGGWVTLRARPGGGTVVEVRLPRLPERSAGPQPAGPTEYARAGTPESGQGDTA
jgi:signal transduction histidine kinase